MRFITEFEITPDELKYANNPIKGHRKSCAEERLGEIIAESFGWEEKGRISRHGASGERYTLEIEAFPMDKWIEFKKELFIHLQQKEINPVRILEMIKDLEFYSNNKKAVDELTNLSDQMEYRGPNSHCKACEDEAAGIKHIQAQKHTCRKRKQ